MTLGISLISKTLTDLQQRWPSIRTRSLSYLEDTNLQPDCAVDSEGVPPDWKHDPLPAYVANQKSHFTFISRFLSPYACMTPRFNPYRSARTLPFAMHPTFRQLGGTVSDIEQHSLTFHPHPGLLSPILALAPSARTSTQEIGCTN